MLPDLVERLLLELAEADDDVGDLDAGVVDVVLHFDRRAAEAQHAHQRVAERRVAQVADVRRLVRIDGGVLDDGLSGASRDRGATSSRGRAAAGTPADRDTGSGSRSARRRCARRRGWLPSAVRELLRDGARRLAQRARQLERDRRPPDRRARASAAPRPRTAAPRRGRTRGGSRRRSRRGPVVERSESWTRNRIVLARSRQRLDGGLGWYVARLKGRCR